MGIWPMSFVRVKMKLFKRSDRLDEARVSEIEYLRGRVKELEEKLLMYSDQAFQNHLATQSLNREMPPTQFVDPIGQIQNMTAETEEEKRQRAEAVEQARSILGAI